MKKIYILFGLMIIGSSFSAQELFTCYDEWKKVFENRGANPVDDGAHDNIVVTVRGDNHTECLTGRAEVKDGLVSGVFLYFDDGTYEKMEYEFKKEQPWSIFNGISRTRITKDEEMINVMFTDRIKPKKKKLKTAPKPNFDLN